MTETPRQTWTDERLDDLSARMDAGFERVDSDVREFRAETNQRFEGVDRTISEFRTETNQRFEALNRNMWIGGLTIVAAVIGTGVLT